MVDANRFRDADAFVYKRRVEAELRLHVLWPERREAMTGAVIYFAGGGWERGGPDGMIANADWLQNAGLVGIVADYRVRDRHGTSPLESVRDARSAVRYVRAQAPAWRVDPDRIVVGGGSAGGHLAACTLLPGLDEPEDDPSVRCAADALLLHNPVTGGPGFGRWFFDAHPEANPSLHVAPGWPPTIVSHGTADDVTPYADAVAFVESIRAVGSPVELVTVDGAGHSCDWPSENPAFPVVMTRMTAFLRRHGFLPA